MSIENEYIQMGEEGIRNTAEETKNKVSKYNKGKEIGYFWNTYLKLIKIMKTMLVDTS